MSIKIKKCECKGKGCENCLRFDKHQFDRRDSDSILSSDRRYQLHQLKCDRYGREIDSVIEIG